VYRKSDRQKCVLKRMSIGELSDKELDAYNNEVRLLSSLVCPTSTPRSLSSPWLQEHPGIVSFIESFHNPTDMTLNIVMAYCDGGDLTNYLKHQKGLCTFLSGVHCQFITGVLRCSPA